MTRHWSKFNLFSKQSQTLQNTVKSYLYTGFFSVVIKHHQIHFSICIPIACFLSFQVNVRFAIQVGDTTPADGIYRASPIQEIFHLQENTGYITRKSILHIVFFQMRLHQLILLNLGEAHKPEVHTDTTLTIKYSMR